MSPPTTCPFSLGLRLVLHSFAAVVVVRELLHMRERDLASDDRIVASDVRLRIVAGVLELDVHPLAELLEVEAVPVDADRVASVHSFKRV
jgi:hypothetical protein